ncbi:MAG: hypothetical protein HY905_12840 [Deltaproteobacteria bacterium]|nr:hypothetical protein [Deltaproteobacteria bacterium]
MSKILGTWTLVGCLAWSLAVALPGCSSGDDGAGGCANESCRTRCLALGYPTGGQCTAGNCVCGGGGDGGGDADATPDVTGPTTRMTGKVWSPGGLVPISGALVYFAFTDPAPIPPGAYPETCQDPPAFHALSAADGSWAIDVLPGTYRLVTQKGQFRRIRDITVPETGPVDVDPLLTTLPSRNDEGDTIPHIALVWALEGGDHIEDVLAKMQMGEVGSDDRLVLGTEQFDLYNTPGYPPNTDLLESLDRMLEYHILFFPCTVWFGYDGVQLNDPTGPLTDPGVLENLRAYARAGGKIYATDMMYDIFEQPMPEYVEMCGDDAQLNAADEEAWAHGETMSGWTSHGRSIVTELSAWLDANVTDHENIDFLDNFVWIDDVFDTPDPDPAGPRPPTVWVTGDFILDPSRTLPLTVTWPYGAGKVLFSTYHTVGEGGHPSIYPQEYILIYLIMEIGVCQEPFG